MSGNTATSVASSSRNTPPNSTEWSYDTTHAYYQCHCGLRAPLQTTWKRPNAGRRFYGCPNWSDRRRRCDFFQWEEGDWPDRAKMLIYTLKKENQALRAANEINDVALHELRATIARMTKSNGLYHQKNCSCMSVVVAAVVIWIVTLFLLMCLM